MKTFKAGFAVAVALVAAACGGAGDDDPGSGSTFRGRVLRDGAPAAGVAVTLADLDTVTDADGRFTFDEPPLGEQTLSATLPLANDSFVSRTTTVVVGEGEVATPDLTLPEPVELSLTDATSRTLSMSWTASTDPGFREYRVVASYAGTFTEDSSEVRRVATELDDTAYVDLGSDDVWLSADTAYHYRVYVMDEHGLLGGSNILTARTKLFDVESFAVEYRLEPVRNFAGEAEVGGVAWDGEALWLSYREEIGGYYENDRVTLARYDLATRAVTVRHVLDDVYAPVAGLAWANGELWVNFSATGQDVVKAIDPATGAVIRTFATESGIVDLDFDGEHLLFSNLWNQVHVIDPIDGALLETLATPFDYSCLRGIAHRDGQIWLSSQSANQLAILDETSGAHIGVAAVPADIWSAGWNYGSTRMTFAGDQLVFLNDSRIYLFDVVAVDPAAPTPAP